MKLIASFWKNFKTQPEIWFFYGFLLTFTLSVRKVLWFFPLRGEFNEYSGVYLYLSDIFLGLTIITWIFTILYNKIDILSIVKNIPPQKGYSTPERMFHVEHFVKQVWNILWNKRGILLIPITLVAWSFISLIWAENKIVTTFRSVKMLEFYLLYIFVLFRLFYWNISNNVPSQNECSMWNILREKRRTILNKIFRLTMIIGLFQAIIGILQFILQHSIGLFWLKESLILPEITGVAKVIFNGEVFVRSYGLFPHPNILGGFLMFSIFISWLYYKMFHLPAGRQAWNNFLLRGKRVTWFRVLLGIQLLALILTFSKSAILGLFLGLIYIAYVSSQKECSTPEGMFHVEHPTGQAWNISRDKRGTIIDFLKNNIKKFSLICLIFLILVFITKPDFYSLFFKGLDERVVYINVSRGTISDNLFLGLGNGQFVISMENLSVIVENWMLEPVHNVFLLIWNELGLVGLLILILFIWCILKMFHVEHPMGQAWNKYEISSELAKTFGAIFIGLLFIMFFDHYLWDIQQGSFLLWLTLGFLVGAGEWKNYLTK